MSLVARQLESTGIPTIVVGSARDIVEQCGVPRFLFTDFPLGNPMGKPDDVAMQREILEMAFTMLENTAYPRTTVQAPYQWDESGEWRETYMQIE